MRWLAFGQPRPVLKLDIHERRHQRVVEGVVLTQIGNLQVGQQRRKT